MELYRELLIEILRWEEMEVTFPQIEDSLADIVNLKSVQALQKIRDIVRDDRLEDDECFMQIEEVVCTLEALGSDGGLRHDG
ncbi:MAG: hypothetical protein HFJ79_00005 [Clostridiales bacterium]|jgi:hypothetical protein|nr:hypothetical protein [Clostridiales bacterium]